MAQISSTGNQLAFGDHRLADIMKWRAKTTIDALPGVLSVTAMLTTHHLEPAAATRLARFWNSQGKPTEARDLLAPTYGWFTEGYDTADCKGAVE